MSDHEPKKLLILYILEILRKHSDLEHTLSQQRILDILKSEYDVDADRKTVRRNLSKLMAASYPIRYQGSENENEEFRRTGKTGNQETILTNWYYAHEFSTGELRILIENVLLADGLPQKQRLELVKKLEGLSSKYLRSSVSRMEAEKDTSLVNAGIPWTLEMIDKAIHTGRQITFCYCDCGTDFKSKPRKDANGKKRKYSVSPYQIIAKNGHQYLICNLPQYDDLTHFRIDRIQSCDLSDEPARPLRNLHGFENGLRLSEYIKAHPNLWSGKERHITFRCKQNMMNDIADSFGTELDITQQPDDMILVNVYAGEDDMLLWAVQYADAVEVTAPQDLRERIAERLKNALKQYED